MAVTKAVRMTSAARRMPFSVERNGGAALLSVLTFFIALGYMDGRPFHLVLDPVFMCWSYYFGLIDDPGLYPRVFWLRGMHCKNR